MSLPRAGEEKAELGWNGGPVSQQGPQVICNEVFLFKNRVFKVNLFERMAF